MPQSCRSAPPRGIQRGPGHYLGLACPLLAAGGGLLALLGWLAGESFPTTWCTASIPMAPTTAGLVFLLGMLVFLHTHRPQHLSVRRVCWTLGGAATLVSALLLVLSLLGIRPAFEHLGMSIPPVATGTPVGHISPLSAACLVLLGMAFLTLLPTAPGRRWHAAMALIMAAMVVLTSVLVFVGYVLGAPALYGSDFIPPALPTTLALLLLGTALLVRASGRSGLGANLWTTLHVRTNLAFVAVFALLAAGLLTVGNWHFQNYANHQRAAVQQQLNTIAQLKADELGNWREDNLKDAAVLFKNTAFRTLVRRYFDHPQDAVILTQLNMWLGLYTDQYHFDQVRLVDPQGVTRLSIPANRPPLSADVRDRLPEVLRQRQVEFMDFHACTGSPDVHLDVMVPILDAATERPPLGVVLLRINPAAYLYPLLHQWPGPSATAETLLVRREGNTVVFLNELRFQKNTALQLRLALHGNQDRPAIKAVLGQVGIVEGVDYRGVPVLAALRPVANSPWFLVARMDIAEAYAPLRERWWMMLVVVATLLLGTGLSVWLFWRQQHLHLFREKARLIESLHAGRIQLAQAMDLAHLVNWEYDVATDQFTFDDRFYAQCGTTATREGGPRMSAAAFAQQFLHPDDAHLVVANIAQALRAPEAQYTCKLECRLVRRDGVLRHLLVNLTTIRDGAGHIIGLHGANQDITERRTAEEALRIEQANLKAIFASAPVGMLLLDEDTMIVDANSVLAGMVSRRLDQIIDLRGGGGMGCTHSLEHPRGCGHAMACKTCPLRRDIEGVLRTGNSVRGAEIQTSLLINGQEVHPWLSVSAEPVQLNGRKHVIVAVSDITDRKRAEEDLRERTEMLQATNAAREAQQLMLMAQTREMQALLDGMPGHSFLKDRQGRYIAANESFCQALGRTEEEILCTTDQDLFPPELAAKRMAEDQSVLSGAVPLLETEDMTICDQQPQWMLTRKIPVRGADGAVERLIGVSIDITARKAMETELRTAARTDKLTGLPNRALLSDRLQQALLRAARVPEYHFGVLFLDFDRFKTINDSLGHDVGDLLLQEIGRRLQTTVRSGDSLSRQAREHTTARLGGDEFVVLLDGIGSPNDATVVADRLLTALAQPYHLGAHTVYSTASIGIVTSDILAGNAHDLLRDADTAMYEAKLAGKGQYVVFDVAMRQRVQSRLNLETDLRPALDAGQLFLMYQPIVSLQNGQIESFEALVRWQHPTRGLISPGEFIPIAEDTGLILLIGEWVLREACRQFVAWRQGMGAAAPRSISVNLSRKQLLLPDLPQTIRSILEQTGMPSGCLHLEVTESTVMKDATAAAQMLQAIKQLGVKLDIDDFGTGHSSLACLHQFPIDTLKIDRSFVANLERGRDFAALVHAVAQLARNLNISVVAEGIETIEQALVLQSLECEFGQGYLFSKPLRAQDVPEFKVPLAVLPGMQAPESLVGAAS